MTSTHISPAPRELLRDAGLKVTAPRLAVLLAVERAPHSDADSLFAAVRRELPGTSLQAVYGVLGALTTAGLLRRIDARRARPCAPGDDRLQFIDINGFK